MNADKRSIAGTEVREKLLKIAAEIAERGNANLLDDSKFIPLLDMLIDSFARAGLSAALVEQLRRHACEVDHRYCQQAAPETAFEENVEIMFSHLPPSLRSRWQESLA
jgi:hypothetical protein